MEKSHRQGQEGISSQNIWNQGISKNRALWLNVQDDDVTRIERHHGIQNSELKTLNGV
jgi:hypothetical protein